jgi:lysophospholipase L1-like esterase
MVSPEQGADCQSDSLARRVLYLTLVGLAIAASLLVFPNALLWMVAAWIAVGSWNNLRGTSSWLPFAVCVAALLIKRPDWSLAMVALSMALVGAASLSFWNSQSPAREFSRRWMSRGAIGVVWTAWIVAIWESRESTHGRQPAALDQLRPIVCVGDSLTTGLSASEAFPEYLRGLVSVPVVNWGRAGVTARDITQHLPEILEQRPQIVVLELGGHDFLRGYGRAATRASLVQIIEACQQAGARVMLVEIPRGFITDPFSGLERELAREYDLELIPDTAIRMLVVRSPAIPVVGDWAKPHLSDDGLHPNEAGAKMLAEIVHRALQYLYGPPVSAEPPETRPADSR